MIFEKLALTFYASWLVLDGAQSIDGADSGALRNRGV